MNLDGVASAVVGVDDITQLEANVVAARDIAPLSPAEQRDLLAEAERIYNARKSEAWFINLPGRKD